LGWSRTLEELNIYRLPGGLAVPAVIIIEVMIDDQVAELVVIICTDHLYPTSIIVDQDIINELCIHTAAVIITVAAAGELEPF
jgi:hypothetical protein